MITVVGVRFKKAGKIYYFDPDEFPIEKDDHVIVETARGIEFGAVVIGKRDVSEEEIIAPLKKVLRIATPEDIEANRQNKERNCETFKVCEEKIRAHGLEMKLIDVEYTFDNNKVIFYFTADGRIDFRELVKDLASVFKTRIELRQIGVRDEAKMVNGIGPCGIGLCCANWLGDFAPVSIKMAKDQNLSLNPTKISGICGRLMCCLKYEHETYQYLRKNMPNRGDRIMTIDGPALVVDTNILLESVKVRHINGEQGDSMDLGEDILVYRKAEIKGILKKSQQVDTDDDYTIENAEDMPPELLAEIQAELRQKKCAGKNCGNKGQTPAPQKRSKQGNHATWKSARQNADDEPQMVEDAWDVPAPKHEPVREPKEAIHELRPSGKENKSYEKPITSKHKANDFDSEESLTVTEKKNKPFNPRHRNNKNKSKAQGNPQEDSTANKGHEKPREQQSHGTRTPRHKSHRRPKSESGSTGE